MTCQNGRQLLLRGEDGARGEWRLLAACHNLTGADSTTATDPIDHGHRPLARY